MATTLHAETNETTNAIAPITARDFYNAGTRFLAAKKFAEAERMFQASLAAQDERVQPPALFNLGHTRFATGVELLKNGPDAQKTVAQGRAATETGANALRSMEAALAGNDVAQMVAAYVEGRGARKHVREAEKAVQAAMESYGKTLSQWRRALDDFKSAAELNPADTNAAHNAEVVAQSIAVLVDSLRQMAQLAGQLGAQKQQLGDMLGKLKGRIPAPDAPPGSSGDDDEDGDDGHHPDQLQGQEEKNAGRDGEQLQLPISPEQAGEMLDRLSVNGSKRLPMSDQSGKPKDDKNRGNW